MTALSDEKLQELAAVNPPVLFKQVKDESKQAAEKETISVTADNQHEVLADMVTPLWQMR